MTSKIFKSFLGFSILVIIITALGVLLVMKGYMEKLQKDELASDALMLKEEIILNGNKFIEKLPRNDKRITFIRKDGKVLYDSYADFRKMDNHMNRKEVQEALNEGVGISERASKTIGKKTLYYAVKIDDNNILRVAITADTAINLLYDALYYIIGIVIIMIVVSIFTSRGLSKKIVEPINNLDLVTLNPKEAYDELHPLLSRIRLQQNKINENKDKILAQKNELSSLIDNLMEGLIIFNGDMEIVSFNKKADEMLSQYMGRPLNNGNSVLELNREGFFYNSLERSLEGHREELEIKLGNRYFYIVVNPTYKQDGLLNGGLMIIMDATERVKRDALRREFTANVSHELKTPLTSIFGFAEIMKNGMVKEEDMVRFANNIYNEAQRLIGIVGDILKLSDLEENKSKDFEDIELKELISQVRSDLLSLATKSDIDIVLEGENLNVEGNYRSLYEIAYNLTENAIKYNVKSGIVKLSTFYEKERMGFFVEDSGIGISTEEQARVFERFYRVDKGRSNDIKGSGLGLAIVKHAAALNGVEVSLESRLGVGTKVMVFWKK